MISATSTFNGPPLSFNATVNGLPIYLDNHSIIALAKGDARRRQRFIDALHDGADLMFSITNAVELAGPQGYSSDRVKDFLDQVGPRWFPVELDTTPILDREAKGQGWGDVCVSTDFVKAYFNDRACEASPGSGKLIVLSDDFFRLSHLLDWLAPHRKTLRERAEALDGALIANVAKARAQCDEDPELLDRAFPVIQFSPAQAATFVQGNLIQMPRRGIKGLSSEEGRWLRFLPCGCWNGLLQFRDR